MDSGPVNGAGPSTVPVHPQFTHLSLILSAGLGCWSSCRPVNSPSRSGVFSGDVDRVVEQFTESISFDLRLYRQDIEASIAHAHMLASVGHLTKEEAQLIERELRLMVSEIEAGEFVTQLALEDIHMHVEAALTARLASHGHPSLGKRLHTARSRNDQVSTDFRLWVREAGDQLINALREIQSSFLFRSEQDLDVILPAYTHLQRAQPVLAPHYWLAYCEKLQRDIERLTDCRRRTNRCPLGTAAVAGTSLKVDRQFVAAALGFDRPTHNSLDSSSDRDFAVEFAFVLSLIGCHLSGWAEEWILWSTSEFGFLRIPDAYCTGSSIMPQKVNPDVLELIRGKSARSIGCVQTLLVLVKGLPLAYNRDLQEDKRPLFDAFDSILACCQIAAPLIRGAELQRARIAERLEEGYLDATTLMEWLIKKQVPQRLAHQFVGRVVRHAMQNSRTLEQLTMDQYQALYRELLADEEDAPESPFDDSVYQCLGAENAVNAFQSFGSTARSQVTDQIARWRKALAEHSHEIA